MAGQFGRSSALSAYCFGGGLTLAVPLVELGTIIPMQEKLTFIFGQIDWMMGLLPVKNGNLRIINTAKVVMPERYAEHMADNFAYAISINDMDWALAVDSVSNAITLEPEDVRWRTERSKRPWLAGTVVEHMCSLVDVSQLAAMFEEANNNK
ncbi:chemotaxis protein CheW [Oceanicoccus sp. KOV_DT_Chl]|uniref:chemotaxis protein CheW n=1 Tax=Oceanicoccus sp. KOV_DT_Chl TaxID=1904639 RepID=UPI000C7DEC18|nr:chemotaxis protein CheW [Oceanicoccus sp. KOV_DT_Chl]